MNLTPDGLEEQDTPSICPGVVEAVEVAEVVEMVEVEVVGETLMTETLETS